MIYKSETPLFCRSCGKAIPKRTDRIFIHAKPMPGVKGSDHLYGVFNTRAEIARVVNEQIMSVARYSGTTINSFTKWDGVSYKDRYFCSGPCVERLAYACAREGHCLPAFNQRKKDTPRVGGANKVGL